MKREPPYESLVNRFLSSMSLKLKPAPNKSSCAPMFCERKVPSPKNFCEKAKIENPALIGRSLIYGSVNENWNERWRLPAARLKESTSPRPSKLLVEYSRPKNEPPMPEMPPLKEICCRPRSATFNERSTVASSSFVRRSTSLSLSIGLK